MKKKIALVTGGAGFIGSHVVDLLIEKNYEVRVVDSLEGGRIDNLNTHLKNSNLKFEKKDISSINNNTKIFNNVDYLFHFAGIGDIVPSIENPIKYFKNNVQGTISILEHARNKKIRKFVYAASSSCYGIAKTPTDEKHKLEPQYPYALSKLQGEMSVLHWNKVYKLPVNSLRIFNAYGRRVRTTGAYGAVMGVFLKQRLSKKPLTIVGNGNQKRDFLHVKDLANAFYLAAVSKYNNKIYNVGAGKPISINYLAKIIGGKKLYLPKRPGEPYITFANINKIQKELKWKPNIKFEFGIKDMIDNIQDWDNAPLWNKSKIKNATKNWFKYMK
ncbi:GDP-mannose 4,6-dehydratase [Pelagibacteraceae bacterium]|nr:GDP-mannose 4,6-dehydratase [Pelagibacteraceae bacterium]